MESGSDTVELHIFGLRTVVPKPVTARADLNLTWYQFLNDVCGIAVIGQISKASTKQTVWYFYLMILIFAGGTERCCYGLHDIL